MNLYTSISIKRTLILIRIIYVIVLKVRFFSPRNSRHKMQPNLEKGV
jgi:hypothetical protein